MDPYVGQKNLCTEICGKDCPQRHSIQMQKFPHLLEKSPFPSDIYSKEFLQRHSAQFQPAFYADIYLKDFMPHPNLHIASHLVEKTFHPELYAKDLHSMLTQRMTPSLEKAMLNSDIYSKEYLQRHSNSMSSHRINSHLSDKAAFSDRCQKEYAHRTTVSQSSKTHTLSGEKFYKGDNCDRNRTPRPTWKMAQWNNKLYQQELYNKEYMQRLGMPVSKSSSVSEKAVINNIYTKDFSLKPGSQTSSIHTPNNSTFHNTYSKEYIQRFNSHSQMIKVAPRTNHNEICYKDSFQEQHSQTTFHQVLPNQEKSVENVVNNSNKELSSRPNIPTHSHSYPQAQMLSHRSLHVNEKLSHHTAYNNRSFSQRPIPQIPLSKCQESAQRNAFRRETNPNSVSTGSGSGAQIPNGKPLLANETYKGNRPPSTGGHMQLQITPHIPTNIVRPFQANENDAISYPSRPDNVASPEKPQQDTDNCRLNQSQCENIPSPNLINLNEKPAYEMVTNSDKEGFSKDNHHLNLDVEDADEKPNFSVPYYNRCPTPHSCNSDSPESPVDNKPFQLNDSSDDELSCQKSALSASTTKLQYYRKPRSSQGQTFQCSICLKHFAQRYYLQIHNRTHTGEKPFHCDLCPKRFVRRDTLQIHRRSHTGEKPYQCGICLKQFAQRHYLQIHERTHTREKPYQCGVCFKQFAQRNYLHVHQKIHAGRKQYECDVCHEQFTQKDYLQVHKRTHTGEKPFQCDMCIQKFARRDTLQVHRRIHTGERPFQCNFCHKQFAQSGKLQTHVRTHMRYKPHQCDICHKQFAQRYYLHIHKRSHSGEKPFECDQCHKQFAQRYYLQIHQRTHTGERPYHCDFCPKQFARRDTLQIHIRTHTGERPYECNVCGQRFAQKDKLQIHQRIHSGERPFACEFCPKRFSQQNTLQLHRRIHTGEKPYKCEVCSRRFAQRNYLVMHARTHSGEKPFYCDHCGQKFARRDTLQIHRRTHAEPSQFPCDLCDKKFSQYEKMRQHKQVEHNTLTAIHNQTDGEVTDTSSPVSPKVEDNKEDISSKPIHEFPSVTSYLWQL